MGDIRDTVLEEGYAIGCLTGDVITIIWRRSPIEVGIQDYRAVFRATKARRPQAKFGLLTVIEKSAGTSFPKGPRDLLGKLLEEYRGDVAGSVVVCEASGVLTTIVRALVNTYKLINRTGFQTRVETDLATGAETLREICAKYAVAASPSSLRQAVEELRSQMPPAARRA